MSSPALMWDSPPSAFLWWFRDKHVSLRHLSQWTILPGMAGLYALGGGSNLPLDPCDIFSSGRHKSRAQAMALSTLVSMEMLKALSATSLTKSILKSPPWTNPTWYSEWRFHFLLHLGILYVPIVLAKILGSLH